MNKPFRVFIGSAVSNMDTARAAVRAAIQAVPLTRPWLFEFSSASSTPLEESYLRKIQECDVFLLLLNDKVPTSLKAEVEAAQTAGKPMLIFVDYKAPSRVLDYVAMLQAKYVSFRTPQDLANQTAEAICDELIRGYRQHGVALGDLGLIGDFLEALAQNTVKITVGGDQIITGGPGATHGSAISTGQGVAVSGSVIHGDLQTVNILVDAGDVSIEDGYLLTPSEIRRVLEEGFSEEELRTLAFDLNLDYDTLPGASRTGKVREIVTIFWRREHLDALVREIGICRPGLLDERLPLWKAWSQISKELGALDYRTHTRDSQVIAASLAKSLGMPLVRETPDYRNHLLCYWLDTLTAFRNTRLPTSLPLALLHWPALRESDLDDLGQIVSTRLGESRHIALILLFSEGDMLRESRQLLADKRQQVRGYDIILVDRDEMQRLMLAKEPQNALRHLILSRADLASVSPYTITGPVSDNVFFGL